ncbi:hypothetical protein BDF20DRAFT_839334 [Mycotypha africana]|uniref:uncharacterized protein n=1 Tax=Mycotypha africana TaxID=64632 RepID=UPI002301DC05|nr:uncharacterized protein BDF20DRAFT_839334 [Mycotypha africana]KAI8968212.1 hypothetical protein BDF20DRAFT_839334 [Mycotypha africana]
MSLKLHVNVYTSQRVIIITAIETVQVGQCVPLVLKFKLENEQHFLARVMRVLLLNNDYHIVPMTTQTPSTTRPKIRLRNLFSTDGDYNSKPVFSLHRSILKRWRWWHYVALLIVVIAVFEVAAILVGMTVLAIQKEPVTFSIQAMQYYPNLTYQTLDRSVSVSLPADTTVYHVTKEFGPATMGGMGVLLTSLAQAQMKTGKIQPSIVLPFYTFLKKSEQYPIERTTDLYLTLQDERNRTVPVEYRVSEFQYDFEPIENFEQLPEDEKLEIITAQATKPTITVYLIGPGKMDPYNRAFKATSAATIYSAADGLPQEWRDQFFAKAAANFLIWKATGKHEQSLFDALDATPRVDVVHLHGATNAYTAKYINEPDLHLGSVPPAIVYTMHDYLDELQYTNTLPNAQKFLNTPKQNGTFQDDLELNLLPYTFGSNYLFMSPLGIDNADAVTLVSESMAKDMVEGRLDFYLKEVVMPHLLHKAENKRFFGISNGIDTDAPQNNPFTDPKLVQHKLNYPAYAKTLLSDKVNSTAPATTAAAGKDAALNALVSNYWSLPKGQKDRVIHTKRAAKQYLIDQGVLRPTDLDRPVVLFVGRFQYNKGLDTFEEAAKAFKANNMKFVIFGQANNYPMEKLKKLKTQYPDTVALLPYVKQQAEFLIFARAAADFVYVPSQTESFGLVAAEGLSFGSAVISTGVGGLSEFLVDREVDRGLPEEVVSGNNVESHYRFNAYLFDAAATSGDNTLSLAIQHAAEDYNAIKNQPVLHEVYALRNMLSAFNLAWDRGHEQGPVYDYLRIYQQALSDKRTTSVFDA